MFFLISTSILLLREEGYFDFRTEERMVRGSFDEMEHPDSQLGSVDKFMH